MMHPQECIMLLIEEYGISMKPTATTLGNFVARLMQEHQHNNSSLAQVAGVSESVIRNLLKHGNDDSAKDPDPRTLRRVADALQVDPLSLFRLAGYLAPPSGANSVRAEYLADVFDELPIEKQDAVMGVVEAMTENPVHKGDIQEMRTKAGDPLAGIDIAFPEMLREAANELIVQLQITSPNQLELIKPNMRVLGRYQWNELPLDTRQRILALIRYKVSVNYDPTLVDAEWRK